MEKNGAETNKNKRGFFPSLILSLSLASTLVLYQNCGGSLEGQDEGNDGGASITSTLGTTEDFGSTYGVTSFESTYANLKVITGIEDGSCDAEYEAGKNSLPSTNNLTTLNSAAQGATAKIAACLCLAAVNNNVNGGQARLLGSANLTGPASAMSAADKEMMATSMMNAAWGANNQSIAPQAKQILTSTVDQLGANGASALEAGFGVCVTTLSSLATSLL
jgi:hypothetical protein